MEELNIQSLMDRLPQAFLPERAAGMAATIHFHLTGERGGDWVVTIRDQRCEVAQGSAASPDLLFTADAQDCLDLFTGKLDGLRAYMQGRFQLTGPVKLALKLVELFDVRRGA